MSDKLGIGKLSESSVEVIKLVYPDLAQPGLRKVGQALETVLELSNTILLPAKLASTSANFYFKKWMKKYGENLDVIPDDEIGTVIPEIGLPVIEELLKITNEEVAEMFINLLTNASHIDKSRNSHPSFIQVIRNLSKDEAKILN
ncbi:hypothetical protein J2S05_003698 [Alkalicoccobacillus murimartini]|uniref:DUF4393 domain-containing protein n=1 Tax=Alkalicoccobacillus murimartini TaxID=171685 RepID=A0ABT9YPC1_9BACI|nr:hypothetical protein [Alkalicoccobacillus murimartini]